MDWIKPDKNKAEGVSLCMITKNEESNPAGGIESFLKHHLPMVNEVVLVDTGSTDKTRDIALGFDNVSVFDYKWDGSFSNPRNFSLKQANYDHILVLDADEKLMHQPRYIKPRLTTMEGVLFGYEFVFIDVPQEGMPMRMPNSRDDGCPDSIYYNHRVRYFMNLPCLLFRGEVHEQLGLSEEHSFRDFVASHIETGVVVNHYSPSREVSKKKQKFYEELYKESLIKK